MILRISIPCVAGLLLVAALLVCRWLESRHFVATVVKSPYRKYGRGTASSPVGTRHEIEVFVSPHAEEVSSLYCRFALARDTPVRLEQWELFVQELCGAFGLRIAVRDAEAVGPERFIEVLQQDDHWRDFAAQLGWKHFAQER
jgi:hypothetical protein